MRIPTTLPLLAIATILAGCAGASPPESTSEVARGTRVWSATCSRCHERRPARQFTPDQWSVIVKHMRTRADLTKSEAEAVAAYLRRLSARSPGDGPS